MSFDDESRDGPELVLREVPAAPEPHAPCRAASSAASWC